MTQVVMTFGKSPNFRTRPVANPLVKPATPPVPNEANAGLSPADRSASRAEASPTRDTGPDTFSPPRFAISRGDAPVSPPDASADRNAGATPTQSLASGGIAVSANPDAATGVAINPVAPSLPASGGAGGFVARPTGGATTVASTGSVASTTTSTNAVTTGSAVNAPATGGASNPPAPTVAVSSSGGVPKPAGNSGSGNSGQSPGSSSASSPPSSSASSGDSGQDAGNSGGATAKAPEPGGGSQGGSNTDNSGATGGVQTATYSYVMASNTSGVLGSQPGTYTMGEEMLIAGMILDFNDPNEDVKNWIYYLGDGQTSFPTAATIAEGMAGANGAPVCAAAPKGCEGRVLRWFDLGLMPSSYTDVRAYLANLHAGKLKKSELSAKVTYFDFAVGARNQITLPNIPALQEHVYYVVMLPEGAPIAIAPMELNLEDATQYEQLLAMVGGPQVFVRGIQVKGQFLRLLFTVPLSNVQTNTSSTATTTTTTANPPTSNLKVAPGGSK